jgi:uncharacterized protein YehS (DUF1456 family)
MDNNDLLRRIRFAFDLSDSQMMDTFGQGNLPVTRAEVSDWLKKDDDPAFQKLNDHKLAIFLNGFINAKRGKKEGVEPVAETRLNNNIVMRKLKIALNLEDDDILALLAQAGMRISKHELSALFRKPDNNRYRACNDQLLRNFLNGLQHKYRPGGAQ